MLGEQEGLGFYQLMEQLARKRLIIATLCSALPRTARRSVGRSVTSSTPNSFWPNAKPRLAIKTLVDYAIGQYVNGNNDPMTALMAKLFAAEKCDQTVDKCLQIFGGYGYMARYPIANMYTGSRVNRIYGGTSEIMKEIISRSL